MKIASSALVSILVFFIGSLSICAQSPFEVWTFEYTDRWPHSFWHCPGCTEVPTPSSSPYTQIAYAANGWTNNRANLDPNLFATFNGGRLMGGNYEESTCAANTLGYGTIGYEPWLQAYCAGTSDEITAEFSQPVLGRRIELRGKYPQTLTIKESGRRPFTVDFYPVYRNGGLVGGAASAYLSGKKISGVSIKSDDPEFAFSIQSLSVHKLPNSSPVGKKPASQLLQCHADKSPATPDHKQSRLVDERRSQR